MSFTSTTSRNDYTGNDSTDTYSYTFRIFANTDLLVTNRDTDDVETELTLTTDYTVTGVGDAGGGTIVLVAGNLADDYALTIRRVRPLTQPTDIRNQGDFYPETHEDSFDHQVMIAQQQQDELDRTMKLPETVSSSDFDPTLPADLVGEPNTLVMTNAAGTGLAKGPASSAVVTSENTYTFGRTYVEYDDTDSPISLPEAAVGKLIKLDCSSGAIEVILPEITDLDWFGAFVFQKTDTTAYNVTITRGGTDTINDLAALVLTSRYPQAILSPNNTDSDWGIINKPEYRTDQELTTADLPNETTVYGYNLNGSADYDDGDFTSSAPALTETGALTAGADVLGDSVFNTFDGSNDYLSSADALFNFTGDFTISLWAYRSAWSTPGSQLTIISRIDAAIENGWRLYLDTDDFLYWETYNATALTSQIRIGYENFSAGYHCFTIVRDADAYTALYIDGLLISKINDTSQVIVAAGSLEIGAEGGGANKWNGRLDEIVIHNDIKYTADQVARLYCKSARRKAEEVRNSAGSLVMDFESPMLGELIPFKPLNADNETPKIGATSLIGEVAAGFDDKACGYRVHKNSVFYEGFMRCHATPPSAINASLTTQLPIPQAGMGQASAQTHRGSWVDVTLGAYFACECAVTTDYILWKLLDVTDSGGTAYGSFTALIDTVPEAWAENDGPAWAFTYSIA